MTMNQIFSRLRDLTYTQHWPEAVFVAQQCSQPVLAMAYLSEQQGARNLYEPAGSMQQLHFDALKHGYHQYITEAGERQVDGYGGGHCGPFGRNREEGWGAPDQSFTTDTWPGDGSGSGEDKGWGVDIHAPSLEDNLDIQLWKSAKRRYQLW